MVSIVLMSMHCRQVNPRAEPHLHAEYEFQEETLLIVKSIQGIQVIGHRKPTKKPVVLSSNFDLQDLCRCGSIIVDSFRYAPQFSHYSPQASSTANSMYNKITYRQTYNLLMLLFSILCKALDSFLSTMVWLRKSRLLLLLLLLRYVEIHSCLW